MSDDLQRQVAGLSALLLLEQEAREASSAVALAFVIANRTRAVLPYDHAAAWSIGAAGIRVEAVSGVSAIDRSGPYVQALERMVAPHAAGPLRSIEGVWDDKPSQALICPFPLGRGGFMLFRATPWQKGELVIAERLAATYGHCRAALGGRQWGASLWRHRRWWPAAALGAIALMALPLRQTAIAPATIVAKTPLVAAAPVDGLVAEIAIRPNEAVKAGQVLFRLDPTQARNLLQDAINAERIAEADYLKTQQRAFFDSESKFRLAASKAQTELRQGQTAYASELLERTIVKAERDGVALFSDSDDWIGRPVAVGQKIMTIADPAQVAVEVSLPADDAMQLAPGAEIELFLNVDPLHGVDAILVHAAYEAEQSAEGFLAYRLRADLAPGQIPPRIGLKGSARVYGERAPLYRHLFRRPLAALRRVLHL